MRITTLAAILLVAAGTARADTLDTLAASQRAAETLNACFDRNFEPGVDKSGAQSHRRLLEACAAEWDEATQACERNNGIPEAACRKKTRSLVDDYLGLKGAGIQ